MRIIFLSHYFPPEVNAPASRIMEHARIWTKAGHHVTVVTCAPNHPTGKLYPGYRNRLWQNESIDGINVVRLWTNLSSNERFLRRSLNFVTYFLSATFAAPFLPRADVVVSTSPQFFCGLAGFTVSRIKRLPWVLEIRDLWPASIIAVGAMKRGPLVHLMEKLASWSYRTADRVIALTEAFSRHIVACGATPERVCVIKNGVDLTEFVPHRDDKSFARSHGVEDKFVASYVGTHGMAHKLETVLEAAQLLTERNDIAFLMVGGGAERARLVALKQSMNLSNVIMLDQQPKAIMPDVLNGSDVSLVLLKKHDLFRTVIPSKMFEAMAMRCPIILGLEGESRDLLTDAGVGIAITPESAEELAAAVTRLADDPNLGDAYGAQGSAYVRNHFDRVKLAERYLELLEEVLNRRALRVRQARAYDRWPMSIGDRFQHIARAVAFGRHMPLAKLMQRFSLQMRRHLRERKWLSGPRNSRPPPVSVNPPRPLFKARLGHIALRLDHIRFVFLGRAHAMHGGIDWRAPSESPDDQLWRMNLHYMEYLEEADDALFLDLVSQWIEGNPAKKRGSWKDSWNSYAVSLRVVVWMQQLAERGSRLPSESLEVIHTSLTEQIRFLGGNLETDLGGNHLIKNIKALIWASAYFDGAEAARWRGKGIQLLRASIKEQVLTDGVHFERSPSYHCQVFADFLECRHALGADSFDPALADALNRMAQATVDLAHPDARVALFNDSGLNMTYAPGECLDVFERLFRVRPHPRNIFALDQSGYFGLRSASSYVIVDCGRVAPDDLPAHGHGDVLGFEWSVDGQRMIVDQGVFEYVAGERRRESRCAANHNTLCIMGADQADFFGSFRCGRRPDVEIRHYAAGADGFVLEGAHNGFAHLPGAPRHVRRFEASANAILICDRVEGRPNRACSIGFLLHPDARVEAFGNKAQIKRGDSDIEMTSTLPILIEDAVWWPDMGDERPTHRLRIWVDRGVSEATTILRVANGRRKIG